MANLLGERPRDGDAPASSSLGLRLFARPAQSNRLFATGARTDLGIGRGVEGLPALRTLERKTHFAGHTSRSAVSQGGLPADEGPKVGVLLRREQLREPSAKARAFFLREGVFREGCFARKELCANVATRREKGSVGLSVRRLRGLAHQEHGQSIFFRIARMSKDAHGSSAEKRARVRRRSVTRASGARSYPRRGPSSRALRRRVHPSWRPRFHGLRASTRRSNRALRRDCGNRVGPS